MKNRSNTGLAIAIIAIGLASSNHIFATQTDIVLNLEGNATCKSVAVGSILEINDAAPPLVGTKIVTGPDGQKISYTVSANGTAITTWQIISPLVTSPIKPVNIVILKAQGSTRARAFHFGSVGVTSDDIAQATGKLNVVSFCYGLSQLAGTSPPLASCSSLALVGGLDETSIGCPTDLTQARVLISLDPGSPDWNVKMCTCNTTFTKCNPNAPVGQTGACPNPAGTLATVPIHIEGVQDPASLVCTTIGGQRLCFKR